MLIGALGAAPLLSACSPNQNSAASAYDASQDHERSEANQKALRERLRYTQIDR